MDSQQLRKNGKPGVLFHRGKMVQEKKTSSIPPPWLHFCLRRSPCYVFLFSFSFEKRKQQSFLRKWLTHWHPLLPAPCSLLQRAQIPWIFSYHICCVGAYSSVCVCVPVCACDYKSRSANRISVLRAIRAISSHARQMMMLSAHNTIFFLPRF